MESKENLIFVLIWMDALKTNSSLFCIYCNKSERVNYPLKTMSTCYYFIFASASSVVYEIHCIGNILNWRFQGSSHSLISEIAPRSKPLTCQVKIMSESSKWNPLLKVGVFIAFLKETNWHERKQILMAYFVTNNETLKWIQKGQNKLHVHETVCLKTSSRK